MTDMLIKLYDLKEYWGFLVEQEAQGVTIRKPIGAEKHLVIDWILAKFSDAWASETDMAFSNRPLTVFIAVKESTLVGFACYDAAALGIFGPTGVDEAYRGRGIGKDLLLACLLDMKLKGYPYAIVGGAATPDFYRKFAGAIEIPGLETSIWKSWLHRGTLPPFGEE